MTRIGLVRHGSTPWNKEGRAQGSADIPLDEKGRAGAEKLGARLAEEDWDFIYASPLLRAKQTAEIIGEKIGGKPIQLDPRLREAGGGQIEGTTEAERIAKWGDNWRELDLGLEQADSVVKRVLPFLKEVTTQYPNKKILIVSHGGVIKHLLKKIVPHASSEEPLKNTSLTRLIWTVEGWDCELFNCTQHLEEKGMIQ